MTFAVGLSSPAYRHFRPLPPRIFALRDQLSFTRKAIAAALGLSLAARIVIRVDVVDLERRCALDLDHDLSARHRVVMHIGVEIKRNCRLGNLPSCFRQSGLPFRL